ncbi:MAG: hypothetical protein ABGY75_15790 [Gemmataceae bacterium]
MFAEWLEVGRIFGLILLVWFALVGWRLLPLTWWTGRPTHTPTSS